ncbi:MAG: hypothetical protein SPM02_05920 [Bacteroidales bacterium]|nr:hypothetical protein [Bacteroidales bacterium]
MALTSNGVSAYYPVYTYAGSADNRQGLKSPVLINVVRWQLLRDCHTLLMDAETAQQGLLSSHAWLPPLYPALTACTWHDGRRATVT